MKTVEKLQTSETRLPYPLRIVSLFSGSRGNCTFVRWGDTRILIDAGMSCRAIERGLCEIGEDPADITSVFLTHEHTDHTKALPVFLKKCAVAVHVTESTAKELLRAGLSSDTLAIHHPKYQTRVSRGTGSAVIGVEAIPVPHDSAACVAYILSFEDTNGNTVRRAAVATDMGYVTEELRHALLGVEDVILESNHDENMLLMGPYPYELKRRILSDGGHLSNACASELACALVAAGTKHIVLAHLSPENNTPELAYLTAEAALKKSGYIRDEDYRLSVARRDAAVTLVNC